MCVRGLSPALRLVSIIYVKRFVIGSALVARFLIGRDGVARPPPIRPQPTKVIYNYRHGDFAMYYHIVRGVVHRDSEFHYRPPGGSTVIYFSHAAYIQPAELVVVFPTQEFLLIT